MTAFTSCSIVIQSILVLANIYSINSFSATSTPTNSGAASSEYSDSVYWNQYSARDALDQASYESPLFWSEVESNIPRLSSSPKLERFRGFCENLRTQQPGREIFTPNGQQLLAQYIFPGLDEASVARCAYPQTEYKELQVLSDKLKNDVSPVARSELADLLSSKPLVSDDNEFEGQDGNDGDTWQRAAWYGWQYMSLRGAKRFMPNTSKALRRAMSHLGGPAHRFVGLARQRRNCTGVEHSDGRNYMLSTLTPVQCPEGCGIIVDGQSATLLDDPVILDNTYPHHVFNKHPTDDRFCLMSECYHPQLTPTERDAISTLFAVKDQFTVRELKLAPWGYDDDGLEVAIKNGAIDDLNFWKEIGYDPSSYKKPSSESGGKKKKKKNKSKNAAKGFGGGFGK